jgi:hypothetical protein
MSLPLETTGVERVKGGFNEHQRTAGGLGFMVEADFCPDIANRMPVPVPQCYSPAPMGHRRVNRSSSSKISGRATPRSRAVGDPALACPG